MTARSTRRAMLAALATCATAGCSALVDSGGETGGSVTERPGSDGGPVTTAVTTTTPMPTDDRTPSTAPATQTTVAQGTESLPTRLWFEPTSLSESERGAVDPLVFADLRAAEQDIVRTALEEGEYTVATEREPAALESLRDRIEARTGNGETLTVYLRRSGTYYRVGFAVGDHIVAHPDI